MKLYRRKGSTYWWVHMTVASNVIRKSTKRTDKREAERVAVAWYREELNRVQFGERPELSLAEACQRYLDSMHNRGSYDDLCRNRDKLLGLGKWSGTVFSLSPTMKMSELRTHHIARLRERRVAEKLSNNSVNLEIRFIQRVYNLCRQDWDVAVDPNVQFKTLKVKPKTRYLSETEAEKVLALLDQPSVPHQRASCLALVLLDTGLRLREATGLRWSDIEVEKEVIRVYRSKTQSWSTVPLTERVAEALDRFRDQPEPFNTMDRAIKHLRAALDAVCNTDKTVIRSAGRATIHSLRDTYASRLVQRGLTLFKVSKLLGHTSMAMTKKYAHLEGDEVASEARSILQA